MNALFEKAVWYFNRLAAMSPAELTHRVQETGRRRRGRSMVGWSSFEIGAGALPHLPIDMTALEKLGKALEPGWLNFFNKAQNGNWHFLGCSWPQANDNNHEDMPQWHLDPVTGTTWPETRYCFDIPFRHARNIGDVKYVWELNRLQFLPPIAALARTRGDATIRAWCLQCIESWIDKNPPFLGVNWASGIELATRAISLILTISLLGPETIDGPLSIKLRAAFAAHAFWLARYPSRYSSANNHLVAEAAALYILSSTLPELPGAAQLRKYGKTTLTTEAHKQILNDGVGSEQSPTYTAFTLEWYLLAISVAGANNDQLDDSVISQMHNAAEHVRWITDTGGAQPKIGDDDEGRVIVSDLSGEPAYVSAIMKNIAAISQDHTIAPPNTSPHLRDLFLGTTPPKENGPSGLRHFDEGGYSVFRELINTHETMLAFDHGPLGYLSIAAHGHADALAVWLHIDNQPTLIDAGTYLYHSGGTDRDYFRGTRSHNTLSIDDQDQSSISGPFNWSHKAKSWRLPTTAKPEATSRSTLDTMARHDGYLKRFGVLHQRAVTLSPTTSGHSSGFCITDSLVGTVRKPDAVARLRYFIAPELVLMQTSTNSVAIKRGEHTIASLTFTLGASETAWPAHLAAVEISPRFGLKMNGQCIVIECVANLLTEQKLTTHIEIN